MTNQLQKLATIHAALVLELTPLAQKVADVLALVLELTPLAQKVADVLALVEALGHQINVVLASSDESPAQTFDQLGGFGFDRGPEPAIPEMAVHAPSTVPPRFVPENYYAMTESEIMPPVDLDEPETIAHVAEFAPDAKELAAMVVTTDLAGKPGRKKTEYTAHEWAHSMHFLHLMKRPPFNAWTAEQQNAKRDEFVASVPADEKMNRWGQRFVKFCGVLT